MQAVSPDLILSDGVFGFDASTFIPVELGESIQFGQNARLNKIIPVNQTKIVPREPTRGHLVPVMELGKRLLQSSRDGDTDGVRELMGKGAPFSTDWLGTSPLHFAAQGNHIKTCEVLLRAGISKDARTKVDRTPLHMAAYEGHADIVELLLKNGAEINSKDMLKMTPLHWAVQNEHIECIKILISYGATVDVVSKFDKTPISMAIEQERVDIVHLLQMAMKMMVERAQSMELQRATLAATQSLTQELEHNEEEEMNSEETVADGGEGFKDESSVDNNSVCDVGQDNKSDSNNLKNAFKVLENHGLTFMPNSATISNSVPFTLDASEPANQIVLSENGKLTLNLSKSNRAIISNQNNEIESSPQIATSKLPSTMPSPIKLKGRKVITIRSDQFLALTGGKYQHMFKKLTQNNGESRNNVFDNIMHNKPIKRIVMTKNKITVAPKAAIQLPQVKINTLEKIECVTKQLQEARRIAEDYKQKYKQKEKECAEYEKQLKLLSFL